MKTINLSELAQEMQMTSHENVLHTYQLIEFFIDDMVKNTRHQELLADTLRSRGSLRCFKEVCIKLGHMKNWDAYQKEHYIQKAKKWCILRNLDYVEG
ncbi:MAG: hypothetical protein LBV67_05470 [Streptococcaceae bacterium]|jgi:hypothetical protein|nr:hypothetical protein [Streptococcaceae bacterium]